MAYVITKFENLFKMMQIFSKIVRRIIDMKQKHVIKKKKYVIYQVSGSCGYRICDELSKTKTDTEFEKIY